ncbi:MAG: ribosome biogenesis GTPase Der [Bdellovibrionota bacterium]
MTQQRTYSRLIAIVGRPNVGKSTLFNRIIRERKSLVHDEPGVTRDRIFARSEHEGEKFYLCDTGGFEPTSKDNIKIQLVEQAQMAIEEAECVIFVVDGREGLHPIDAELVKRLRKSGKNFVVCVNKCDLPKDDFLAEEFRKLGVDQVFPVSAEHSRGVNNLLDAATAVFKDGSKQNTQSNDSSSIKLAIIGRPNVGKSSILNRLVGETRSIVDDRPGTTRDAVDVELKYHGREVTIIDTAGIRKKSRMVDKLEKFSAFRSITCLEECDVAIMVIDARDGATEGDTRVAGYAFEMRKPILIVVNKWDLIEDKNTKTALNFKEKLDVDLRYLRYAPLIFVSALENLRVSKLIPQCLDLFDQSNRRFSTSQVNNALKDVLVKHTPPMLKNKSRRIKFYYATQVGVLPPRFVIFCSHPQDLHFSYKRYVENSLRETFEFTDVPISIIFRERTRFSLDDLKEQGKKSTSKKFGDRNIDDDIRSQIFEDDEPEMQEIEFDDDDSED